MHRKYTQVTQYIYTVKWLFIGIVVSKSERQLLHAEVERVH